MKEITTGKFLKDIYKLETNKVHKSFNIKIKTIATLTIVSVISVTCLVKQCEDLVSLYNDQTLIIAINNQKSFANPTVLKIAKEEQKEQEEEIIKNNTKAESDTTSKDVSLSGVKFVEINIPTKYQSDTKTCMAYQKLKASSAVQPHFVYAPYTYTDPETLIRMCNGRYMIAIGRQFAYKESQRKAGGGYSNDGISNIGRYVDVYLENGVVIPCITGDVKADIHTAGYDGWATGNKDNIEFIIDAPLNIWGENSYVNKWKWHIDWFQPGSTMAGSNYKLKKKKWDGKVVKITVYDKLQKIDMNYDFSNARGKALNTLGLWNKENKIAEIRK